MTVEVKWKGFDADAIRSFVSALRARLAEEGDHQQALKAFVSFESLVAEGRVQDSAKAEAAQLLRSVRDLLMKNPIDLVAYRRLVRSRVTERA